MDVLKEEPSFSHDHFSEVKAASSGLVEPLQSADRTGMPAHNFSSFQWPCALRTHAHAGTRTPCARYHKHHVQNIAKPCARYHKHHVQDIKNTVCKISHTQCARYLTHTMCKISHTACARYQKHRVQDISNIMCKISSPPEIVYASASIVRVTLRRM